MYLLNDIIKKFGYKGDIEVKDGGTMETVPIVGELSTDKPYSRYYVLNFIKEVVTAWRGDRTVANNVMAYFEFDTPKRFVRVYVRVVDGGVIELEEEKKEVE